MAHERLEGTRIDSAARQSVARRVAQHVNVDGECEASGHAKAFYKPLRAIDRQWRLALRQEQERAIRILAEQRPDQPQFVTLKAVNAGGAVLGPPDVDRGGLQVDLLDLDVDELANPQRMAEGQQDQQTIASWVARLAGSLE